jgi:tRNA-dihydrouridine synthase
MKSQKQFIEDMQCSASSTIASDASIMPSGIDHEVMRTAIDRIEVKKTKGGKVHGMRVEENESSTNKRLTARMIHFVNLLVSGNDHITAYSTAYDVSGSTRATIIGNANKLMRDPRITMQLESVLEATKQNVVESDASARRYVMQKLFDKVNESEVSESGQLRALELIGKAVGMFTDRVETTVEQVDTDSLKKELESHLHLLENANKKVKTIQ